MRNLCLTSFVVIACACTCGSLFAAEPTTAASAPLRVLLMGDSTVGGSDPRRLLPKADHLEQIIEKLLAAQPDLPPVEVLNYGVDGDSLQGLLESKRYERDVASRGRLDFIFLRYGLNDAGKPNFPAAFVESYHEVIRRLRRDFPAALITLETLLPYTEPSAIEFRNGLIRKIAAEEGLPVLDQHARFVAELKLQGEHALYYRYVAIASIPANLRPLIPENCIVHNGAYVVVLDNTLDAHFRNIPGWFGNRHPNLAGYHVIGDEIAKYVAPKIRERRATTQPVVK